MKKREFLKSTVLAGAGIAFATKATGKIETGKSKIASLKHWVWERPNDEETNVDLEKKYKDFYNVGIRGIFFEEDSERHFKIAKKAGHNTHRWMWTMNRGEKELLENHPELYAVSRDGESCATNPPYVNYYRWLCPSKTEVLDYLKTHVENILKNDYVDGIHLDYIRYCDVILPVNLWDKYKIEQTKELPEFDFCYCKTCREGYKNQTGIDPMDLEYPDQSPSWRKYRYDKINNVVNNLAQIAQEYKKPITAAVFPTPEIARRIVRQDWTNWNLDAVCPMIYHGFYKEQVRWIGDAVEEGIHFLNGKFPLYAGLFLPDFKSMDELEQGIKAAINNGASGVSLFGKVDKKVLDVLRKI